MKHTPEPLLINPLCWICAGLGCDAGSLLQECQEAVLRHLDSCTGKELANMLRALARLGAAPSRGWMQHVEQHTELMSATYTLADLSMVQQALADMRA
jgi:hypothetical protein